MENRRRNKNLVAFFVSVFLFRLLKNEKRVFDNIMRKSNDLHYAHKRARTHTQKFIPGEIRLAHEIKRGIVAIHGEKTKFNAMPRRRKKQNTKQIADFGGTR